MINTAISKTNSAKLPYTTIQASVLFTFKEDIMGSNKYAIKIPARIGVRMCRRSWIVESILN